MSTRRHVERALTVILVGAVSFVGIAGCQQLFGADINAISGPTEVGTSWTEVSTPKPLRHVRRFCNLEVETSPPLLAEPFSAGINLVDYLKGIDLSVRLKDGNGAWHD